MQQIQLHSTIERNSSTQAGACPAFGPDRQFVASLQGDKLAEAIWEAIVLPISVEKLNRDLMQLFRVNEEDLQPHLLAYLSDLQKQNMIRVINDNKEVDQRIPLAHDREDETLKEL